MHCKLGLWRLDPDPHHPGLGGQFYLWYLQVWGIENSCDEFRKNYSVQIKRRCRGDWLTKTLLRWANLSSLRTTFVLKMGFLQLRCHLAFSLVGAGSGIVIMGFSNASNSFFSLFILLFLHIQPKKRPRWPTRWCPACHEVWLCVGPPHRWVRLVGGLPTNESDSAVFWTQKSHTRRCPAQGRAWLSVVLYVEESYLAVSYIRKSLSRQCPAHGRDKDISPQI